MAIKLNSGFEILRYSDLSYEEMTVELQYKGESVAQINMDSGINSLEIEIFNKFADPDFSMKFKLDELIEAINESKKLLRNYVE